MTHDARDTRGVLIRDVLIFQLKLALDGLKDIVVFQLSIVAALIDFLLAGSRRSQLFYRLLRTSEKVDLWMNLYGASEAADETRDGLFGASRAGSDSLLGKLEQWVRGTTEGVAADPPQGTARAGAA